MRKISVRIACIILYTLLVSIAAPAQEAGFAKVDEFIRAEMESQKIPGLSAAVMKDGRIVFARGYGLANIEHQVAVRPETIFQSGSVGKQFTAAAVMLLVEDGKLSLDDRITKYFPDSPDHWKNITVRHLLTHTAGTTDYPPDFDFRRDYTEDELLKKAAAIPLAFQPGDRWSYSNLGYVMLGILIGRVSGKFYGDFLQERVFKPLGMATARIISEEDIIPNRSSGYRLVRGQLKHQEWVAPKLNTTADGSLYLTLYDMEKWDAALYGEKLLKKSSLDQIWAPVRLNNGRSYPYGFGWTFREAGGKRVIEHGGSWQGFKSFIARYVDDRMTVVVFANLAQTNPDRIAHGIAAAIDPRLAVTDDQERGRKVSAMLRQVLSGAAVPDNFAPEARAELFPDKVAGIVATLKQYGQVNAVMPGGRTEEDGLYSHRRYRIAFNGRSRMCRVVLTKDDRIAGLELLPE